ncbi:restriction endonuclease subunit S [Nocardia flavorosea]|uniref:methylation-associated defense system restriction endonuclease subunit S MAD5 n=1 Tax=Nocardia flavorosea TaxID=53429 RepID=UPI00189300EE|nr:restriction endonuclease subunit S [Nocardia flavorosea]MBF6352872.1 restriction endonuclease subunit S [Nocardia flavorosea]
MKLVDFDNPVRASWLADQGFRLDPGPFISETYAARMMLRHVSRTEQLGDLAERIFRPGIFKRHWTGSAEHGVRFLSSADIFEADLSTLPMITEKSFDSDPKLPLEPGWTLITCSGMTAGRVTYARNEMEGYACTQDVLRVVPGADIPGGYLYTFLASRYGTAMIKGGIYGSSIKHIEPPHLVDIPIPRLGNGIESQIDSLIQHAMKLRSRYQKGVISATEDLFTSAGLSDLLEYNWHDDREIGFHVDGVRSESLRALNFSPRARRLIARIRDVPHRSLGSVCENGLLARGPQFKRIDAAPGYGVKLVGQRQGFWMRPEGRWVSMSESERRAVQVDDETVLVASTGTLGETEVYCRAIFATGSALKNAFTGHFLRIRSGDPAVSNPYLFAFFRSDIAFRLLRSMSTGGKQQDIHASFRIELPIPMCDNESRDRITETVRQSYRRRDEADALEDEAMTLLEKAIREAAR